MASTPPAGIPASLTLPQLEQRLTDIDAQLQSLARYTPRGGFGHVGYRSAEYEDPEHRSSLGIDLAKETPVDQIVLVPTIIRDPVKGFRPDGFPQALRILDEKGSVLAEQHFSNEHLRRISPLIIRLGGKTVSSITVEATRLSQRSFDGKYLFQLAELLIFSGPENVALGRPVKVSTLPTDPVGAWNPVFVTDGSLPYLMNSARGKPSLSTAASCRSRQLTFQHCAEGRGALVNFFPSQGLKTIQAKLLYAK